MRKHAIASAMLDEAVTGDQFHIHALAVEMLVRPSFSFFFWPGYVVF